MPQAEHMDTLSRLMIRAHCENKRGTVPDDLEQLNRDLRYVAGLDPTALDDFLKLADTHHVLVRVLIILQNAAVALDNARVADWCKNKLAQHRTRIDHSIRMLQAICQTLESRGCQTSVIKSLDHWPDLGSDLDLYTTAPQQDVESAMREKFDAFPIERSWGDRLANKWNFRVPGLPELVEIHIQFLGQTGEHANMARRVVERRVRKEVGGQDFYVPAPEERIVISTLQRVYRHFYFRLCDIIDMTSLIQKEHIDFDELRRAAGVAGIWPGVATFLFLIQRYAVSYGGDFPLPEEVLLGARSRSTEIQFQQGFLRVSKMTATGLYGAQLLQAAKHRDLRALVRLPLLPPLAISAAVAYGVTGNDKGIW